MTVERVGAGLRAFSTVRAARSAARVPPSQPQRAARPSGRELRHGRDGDSDDSRAHPYSIAEFRAPTELDDSSFLARHPVASGVAGLLRLRRVPHSWYYRALVQRLEVADMQARLRTAQLDIFHRTFWHTQPHPSLGAPPPVAQIASAPSPPPSSGQADSQLAAGAPPAQAVVPAPPLPSERPVGALDALVHSRVGSERAREYNRALFRQLLPKLRPSWELAWLRAWTRTVGRCERILGWGP